jgi:hypothetical protein
VKVYSVEILFVFTHAIKIAFSGWFGKPLLELNK